MPNTDWTLALDRPAASASPPKEIVTAPASEMMDSAISSKRSRSIVRGLTI
ncbi:Uncharacterised protein [Bordetella pertussis]|nr:Uncharacterised protein [Bordetella pertussis]CPO51842.1 Uncharacterised protein [Bordetella pertussis]